MGKSERQPKMVGVLHIAGYTTSWFLVDERLEEMPQSK
jgi:hypothetical protein